MTDTRIGSTDIETYQRDGVAVLRSVFDMDWIHRLREAVVEAIVNPGPLAEGYEQEDGQTMFFGDLDVWTRNNGLPALPDIEAGRTAYDIEPKPANCWSKAHCTSGHCSLAVIAGQSVFPIRQCAG